MKSAAAQTTRDCKGGAAMRRVNPIVHLFWIRIKITTKSEAQTDTHFVNIKCY